MLYNIIALGDSAKHWDGTGHSVGVNDAFKWGHHIEHLVVCNRPENFPADRLEVIKNSKPDHFYSHKSDWKKYFPAWNKISIIPWYGTYHRDKIYHSDTSPFIAICLAIKLGATKIVLWGVDFKTHSKYKHGDPGTNRELEYYTQLIRESYIPFYVGAMCTSFDSVLRVYDPISEINN